MLADSSRFFKQTPTLSCPGSCPADTPPRPTDEKANAGGGSVWPTSGQHTTKICFKNDLIPTGLSGKKSHTQGDLPCRVLHISARCACAAGCERGAYPHRGAICALMSPNTHHAAISSMSAWYSPMRCRIRQADQRRETCREVITPAASSRPCFARSSAQPLQGASECPCEGTSESRSAHRFHHHHCSASYHPRHQRIRHSQTTV